MKAIECYQYLYYPIVKPIYTCHCVNFFLRYSRIRIEEYFIATKLIEALCAIA